MRPTMMVFDLDPGEPGRDPRVRARWGSRCATLFAAPRARLLSEDLRLEGASDLRPAEHGGHLRGHQAVRSRDRDAAREAVPEARRLEHEEVAPQGKDARRLEPERRPQDDDLRVLAAGARAAHGLDPGHVGRGRGGAEEAGRRAGSSSTRTRSRSESRSRATSSRPCSSRSRSYRSSSKRLSVRAVPDCVAVPVVVEVRVDVDSLAPRCDPLRPLLELPLGVVAVLARERRGGSARKSSRQSARGSGTAARACRRSRARRRRAAAARTPRARTSSRAGTRSSGGPVGSALERLLEPLVVAPEVPGQLPQHRAELPRLDEGLDPLVEALDAGPIVGQALDVGQVAARLDREHEARRGLLGPSGGRRAAQGAGRRCC